MNVNEISWVVVTVIIALIGLIIAILTPLLKLNSSITKLNASIDTLNQENSKRMIELEKMSSKMNEHDKYLLVDKQRLDNHEARLYNLDKQQGLKDVSDRK